jgi:hypothetical protein
VSGSGTIDAGGYSSGSYNAFNGMMANLQVYNNQLNPYQVSTLYLSGINSAPVNFTSLVGWWPLNGNTNDYSRYHDNGTGTVSYAGFSGYSGDSLDGGSFYHTLVGGVQGISQCYNIGGCAWNGNSKLYVPVQQSYSSNTLQQATAPLGLVNNTIPGSAYFNSAQGAFLIAYGIPFNTVSAGYDTISFWMDWVPNSGTSAPFGFTSDGIAGSSSCFGFESSGSIHGVPTSLVSNHWVNIVVAFENAPDPSGGASSAIYVNGTKESLTCGSALSGGGVSSGTSSEIGETFGFTYPFSGSLADVQVYNTLLSQSNVISLYLNNTVNGLKPTAWWPLSSGNSGYTNQTSAITGNFAVEYMANGAICPISNSIGFVAPCDVAFLPFGPR